MQTESNRVYQCDRCEYRCNFRQNLRRHRKTHEAKSVHCEHCPYICRLPQHLRRHLKLVHSFNPDQATGPLFVCATCPFATGSAKAMGIHCTRLHDDPKPWRCSRCEYRARSRCIVRYHEEQVHERRRPFRCETCGLAVVSRRVLAIHRVVHSPDPTPYRCDRCAYATRFLSNLTKHMIVHTDAKPFECSTCNMRFARKANLKTHVNKAHRLLDVSLAFHPSNNDLLEHNIDAILSEEASTFKEDLNVGRINGVQQTLRQKAINKILKSVPGITVPVQALAGESGIEKMFESTRNCGVILQTEEVDEIVLDNPTQLKTVIDVLGTVTERAVVQLPAMALVSIMINGEISCVS